MIEFRVTIPEPWPDTVSSSLPYLAVRDRPSAAYSLSSSLPATGLPLGSCRPFYNVAVPSTLINIHRFPVQLRLSALGRPPQAARVTSRVCPRSRNLSSSLRVQSLTRLILGPPSPPPRASRKASSRAPSPACRPGRWMASSPPAPPRRCSCGAARELRQALLGQAPLQAHPPRQLSEPPRELLPGHEGEGRRIRACVLHTIDVIHWYAYRCRWATTEEKRCRERETQNSQSVAAYGGHTGATKVLRGRGRPQARSSCQGQGKRRARACIERSSRGQRGTRAGGAAGGCAGPLRGPPRRLRQVRVLRALCAVEPTWSTRPYDLSLGVVWYLVPDEEGSADGGHVGWTNQDTRTIQRYMHCDPELYLTLLRILRDGDRSVRAVRERGVLPGGTVFYEARLSFAVSASAGQPRRGAWSAARRGPGTPWRPPGAAMWSSPIPTTAWSQGGGASLSADRTQVRLLRRTRPLPRPGPEPRRLPPPPPQHGPRRAGARQALPGGGTARPGLRASLPEGDRPGVLRRAREAHREVLRERALRLVRNRCWSRTSSSTSRRPTQEERSLGLPGRARRGDRPASSVPPQTPALSRGRSASPSLAGGRSPSAWRSPSRRPGRRAFPRPMATAPSRSTR